MCTRRCDVLSTTTEPKRFTEFLPYTYQYVSMFQNVQRRPSSKLLPLCNCKEQTVCTSPRGARSTLWSMRSCPWRILAPPAPLPERNGGGAQALMPPPAGSDQLLGGDGAVAVGVEEAPHVASAHHCALHGHRRRARRVDDRPVVRQIRLERPARPARRRVREEEGAQLGGGKGARACRKVPRKLTDGAAAARRARGARAVGVGRGEDGLGVLLRREGRLPAARGAVTRRSLHEWRLSLSAVHGRAPPPAADRGEPRASGGGATRRRPGAAAPRGRGRTTRSR